MAKLSGINLNLPGWLEDAKLDSAKPLPESLSSSTTAASTAKAVVLYVSPELDKPADAIKKELPFLTAWQLQRIESKDDVLQFDGAEGPVWAVRPVASDGGADPLSRRSAYARGRDALGALLPVMLKQKISEVEIRFLGVSEEEERGALVGLEIASYRFADHFPRAGRQANEATLPLIRVTRHSPGLDSETLKQASRAGRAVNIARHLVNLPPHDLNPKSYSRMIQDRFKGSGTVSVEVWDRDRLEAERCSLMLAVGAGAKNGPRLVRMSYRPRGGAKKNASPPLAFVGKGITFDTGGLDMKPSSGMRLMKKDMGGSAALVGLCAWAEAGDYPRALDFYLALAENAVDAEAFHPSDILLARNGTSVEIDNTDAEGRLVLADALDVAMHGSDLGPPEAIIDVATLTGAGKIALGAEIASLFCNNDTLADELEKSARESGDLCWRMPLYQGYANKLRSHFADTTNSGDRMGGAITAALFLEKFVGKTPWAHLDIYAWQDTAGGAIGAVGGSGQAVQCLTRYLELNTGSGN